MEIALWIVAAIVALFYVMSGGMKVVNPAKFTDSMPWAQRLGAPLVRAVGAIELLGAIGIVLPQLTGIGAPLLTILAAAGLALVQIVAVFIHLAEKTYSSLPINIAMIVLPLFVFLGRLLWV